MSLPLWDPIELPPDHTLIDINSIEPEPLRLQLQARALELFVGRRAKILRSILVLGATRKDALRSTLARRSWECPSCLGWKVSKQVQALLLVSIDNDRDGKKAEKLRAKILRKAMKRRDKDGRVIADITIEKEKGKP